MADLVSKVLEELSSIIAREIDQEVRLVVGVKKEVEKLTSNFQAIQAVLADAEERQMNEAAIKLWFDKLKDASYDMDNVMDEWSTAILKSRIEVDEHPPKHKRKVCSFIISCCFRCKEVGLRHDIALKIKDLNERLDDIAREKNMYNFKIEVGSRQLEGQTTASIIDVSEVKGREGEKDKIIGMLLGESSEGPNLHVISIVGMGGIGKTTLAQLVYNDDRVKAHFEKRIWVCVPDPFDEIRVAKAILESLSGSTPNLVESESLLQKIQESINRKKFLLILDDMWEEDPRKWKQLNDSLNCGMLGSKILVTTRKENVAYMMGYTNIVQLGVLSNDACWSLFSQIAFSGKNSRNHENLEDVGRKIVDKCKGLPLAVKALGSLLRFKNSRREWESVLDNEVWKVKEVGKSLFAPFLLSYFDLPFELRQCFSYCAVFPKDYRFKKNKLINLWMAQGYLTSSQSKEMEMVGEEYFETLVARSFFQDFEKNEYDGSIIGCKMHDIVHDFAQFLRKNECSVVEINGVEEPRVGSFPKEARHLMIVFANRASSHVSVGNLEVLRSLLVVCSGDSSIGAAILTDLFSQLSCLKMLHLSKCSITEVPSSIGKLMHLRYIDLSENKFEKLPETMCELYNMETLDVSYCENLRGLPCGIGKLVNLRRLSIENHRQCRTISFTMNEIGRISSLKQLDMFVVNGGGHDEASNLGELKNLNHLGGKLSIVGLGQVINPDDARKAQLKSKKYLSGLHLSFSGTGCDEVIEALEPSPTLESLGIGCYGGTSVFPSWIMSITKLRVLTLSGCHNIKHLAPLGKLPSLEVLRLFGLTKVKKVGEEFLGIKIDDNDETNAKKDFIVAFPKLKYLHFLAMVEWEEWDDGMLRMEDGDKTTNISIMPSLRSLKIHLCYKLKALPGFLFQLTTLEELEIILCPILRQRFKKGEGQDWRPNVSHIPKFTISDLGL